MFTKRSRTGDLTMLSLFMMVMLSLVVLEIHEARPFVAMWIVGLAPLLRWAFLMVVETCEDLLPPVAADATSDASSIGDADPAGDGVLPWWKQGTTFAVEGQLWNVYSRLEGDERMFWSGRVDWPGGDDWVEILSQEKRSLEEVLPDWWISFHPVSVAPELIAAFQVAYHQTVASLPPTARKEHVESWEGSSWREILGIAAAATSD